ncbi:hypothetical protein pdam_00022142 [Pocillopora damicornis]|uniref:Uncharacterized protein n=1 Tax=Pocillopora damicornis TaxID=46731 RepID=A0A3M6TSG7_POCDA|nr:hypothetical protein pdam_00022142 [Pocillopora damicornis]
MAPLRISPVPSPINFLSENNFGNDVLTKKYLSNKDSKRETSVTHSNDTTDIQMVTPPQTETAEKSTLKPNETKSSENDNDEDAHAAATAQPQPHTHYPTRQCKAPQRLGLNI